MNRIRLSRSSVGEEEKAALAEIIDRGFLGMGPEVKAFEDELQSYLNTDRHVVCVNTGTSALHLALMCSDIGPGDEVLLPSITYVASFQAVSAIGAKPVACDVCEDNVFIDLKDASKKLSERTRAIMPVHYASNSRGMEEVYAFAKKYNLRVIEDAAHAFGCQRSGKMIGSTGDVVCFSFDGIKNITSGEGGALVTANSLLAERVKDARLLGVQKDTEKRFQSQRSWQFDVSHQGLRYHMSDLMAAIGRAQLRKLKRFKAIRCEAAARYNDAFKHLPDVKVLKLDYNDIIPHIYVIKVLNNLRDPLRDYLTKKLIETGIHYKPNHLLNYYKTEYSLPISEHLYANLLSIPLHAELLKEEQQNIINTIKNFFIKK